jgi:hypothetical protein
MFAPKASHQKALKRIDRYPKATRGKEMLLTLSSALSVNAFPDADFAGLYGYEKPNDPAYAKS